MTLQNVPTPCYVVDEKKLKENLTISKQTGAGKRVSCASGTESIFHVFALSADRAVYQRNHSQWTL